MKLQELKPHGITLYHLSTKRNLKKLKPVVPKKVASRINAFEESKTARVSFAENINGCILGIQPCESDFVDGSITYQLYTASTNENVLWIPNDDIIADGLVFDARVTKEWWCLSTVPVVHIGEVIVYEEVVKTIEYTPIKIGDTKYLKPNGKLDTYLYKHKVIKN